MRNSIAAIETVLGIDVAQHSITLHDPATGRTDTLPNTAQALRTALAPFQKSCRLAVCEATGGHEAVLLGVLHALGIPAHRADGAKISAFARSVHRAKTDRLDAKLLARYGQERDAELARWTPPPACQQQLTTLMRRRADLVAMRQAERARAKAPLAQAIAPSLQRVGEMLDAEIATLEHSIANLIATTAELKQRNTILRELPGIGPTTAAALMAFLPELGTLPRRQLAALAGVAPHPNQTGTSRNKASTQGGRRQIRPILFIAALTAIRGDNPFATFYHRLTAAGKPKKLAIVAVMRKIVVVANAKITQMKLT